MNFLVFFGNEIITLVTVFLVLQFAKEFERIRGKKEIGQKCIFIGTLCSDALSVEVPRQAWTAYEVF